VRHGFYSQSLQAAALALRSYPLVNSSLSPDHKSLLLHNRVNLGIAMATPLGLAVPNIKDVQVGVGWAGGWAGGAVQCVSWGFACMVIGRAGHAGWALSNAPSWRLTVGRSPPISPHSPLDCLPARRTSQY
jgi:hypothetical protein